MNKMMEAAMQEFSNHTGLTGDFFVEQAFIAYYAKECDAANIRISEAEIGFSDIDLARSDYDFTPQERLTLSVIVSFDGKPTDVDYLRFTYFDFADNRGLLISDPDQNALYLRRSDQNHKTEWELNALANIATDENGKVIFPDDPYGI